VPPRLEEVVTRLEVQDRRQMMIFSGVPVGAHPRKDMVMVNVKAKDVLEGKFVFRELDDPPELSTARNVKGRANVGAVMVPVVYLKPVSAAEPKEGSVRKKTLMIYQSVRPSNVLHF